MILIETQHKFLREFLEARVRREKVESRSMVLSDYGHGTTYLVTVTGSDAEEVTKVSMRMPCFSELKQFNVRASLEKLFPGRLLSEQETEAGYDITIAVNFDKLASDPAAAAAVVTNLSMLQRHALASAYNHVIEHTLQKKESPVYKVKLDSSDTLYLCAHQDRISVILATRFKEETDRIFAKVFLQEVADAGRLGSCCAAPPFSYSYREVPPEIKGVAESSSVEDGLGYVQIVIYPDHLKTDSGREATITRIISFRDNLHYHIKCSKAYMHSRMRARVDSFIKVLNRAKMEYDPARNALRGSQRHLRGSR